MKEPGRIILCLIALLLVPSLAAAYDYETGLKAAKKENKPLVLYFYERSCSYCTLMDQETLADTDVSNLLTKDFIYVRVDARKSRDLARQYRINGTPSSWFVESTGKPLFVAPGYIQKPLYLKILQYVKGKHYNQMDLTTFVKKGSKKK
jgi:thioredoxin-related protein